MAHVLLGWELGAGRGHALRLATLAAALRSAGHRITFAVQRLDLLTAREVDGAPVWQAPLPPRLLGGGRPRSRIPADMAEILERVGLDTPNLVAGMVRGWHLLLGAVAPDVAIADFSPFLQMAARGRVPVVAIGTNFSPPPADMDAFPALIENLPRIDQAVLLDRLNAGLAAAGVAPLAALPQVYAADRIVAMSLQEIDPYRDQRTIPFASPVPAGFDARAGDGEEVFVYAAARIDPAAPLWTALERTRLKVRVHAAGAWPAFRDALAARGFAVEPEPLPFAEIAARSRLLVSHGGHGFVTSGLLAGLPHIVCHFDLEKLLNGMALARLQVGGHAVLQGIDPDRFAADLVQLHGDDALAGRARDLAAGLRARSQEPFDAAVVKAVAALG